MSLVGSGAGEALSRLQQVLPVDPARLSDGQLLRFVESVAEGQRQLDALKLAAAAEVSRRSAADAPDSLAKRMGFKTAAGAIQSLTKTSARDAAALVSDAAGLANLPAVEAAVLEGRITRDAAHAIVGELKKVTASVAGAGGDAESGTGVANTVGGVDAAQFETAQQELVEIATTADADQVKARAAEKAAALQVQVVADQTTAAMAKRFFWIGNTQDGGARVSGYLPAGHAAVIRSVLDAYVNPRAQKTVRFEDAEGGSAGSADDRTAGQKKADLLRDVFATQARSVEAPDMGGDHPTVWVSTTLAELESGTGIAHYAGDAGAVPVAEAQQAACTGGVQTVIFGEDGSVLALGRKVRCFTRTQRRAIALRDGGTCLIPGCATPAQWCETHHVLAHRDGGPTDVDNGVLLCWFHHHQIDHGPWNIRMNHGLPEVRYAFGGRYRHWTPAGSRMRAQREPKQRAAAPPGS